MPKKDPNLKRINIKGTLMITKGQKKINLNLFIFIMLQFMNKKKLNFKK